MSYSLLAHLYPHIKGSQEDIATLSLQYLLMQSKELNQVFTKRLADLLHINLEDSLQYVCQVTGKSEEKERPDMAGLDSNGYETILCEMKFYATLTANQPLTYLKRLKENRGKGLVFVCPDVRKTNLWSKLNELCSEQQVTTISESCIEVNGIKLAIITWNEIISLLNRVAASVAISYSADIAQLEGYCNQLDSEAFIPFSAVDISALSANKAERYYQVVDEVFNLLCADNSLKTSRDGVKAAASRSGYVRYLYVDEFAIGISYDRDLWKKPTTIETPFWVSIKTHDWKLSEKLLSVYKSLPEQYKGEYNNVIFLALEPLQDVTLAEVSDDLKNQIMNYIAYFRERT